MMRENETNLILRLRWIDKNTHGCDMGLTVMSITISHSHTRNAHCANRMISIVIGKTRGNEHMAIGTEFDQSFVHIIYGLGSTKLHFTNRMNQNLIRFVLILEFFISKMNMNLNWDAAGCRRPLLPSGKIDRIDSRRPRDKTSGRNLV